MVRDADVERYRAEKARLEGTSRELKIRQREPRKSKTGASRRRKPSGRSYLIYDPATFAALITETISERFKGNRSTAATKSSIPYNTLLRYQKQGASEIRHETLERFRRFVGPARRLRLKSAVLSPYARDALADYDRWLGRELRQLGFAEHKHPRRHSYRSEMEWESDMQPVYDRAVRLDEILGYLTTRFPTVWRPLNSMLVKRGHFVHRARLAKLRVIAPLLDHEGSSQIERGEWELTERELKAFLAAGVTREAILLDRATDPGRAQDAENSI